MARLAEIYKQELKAGGNIGSAMSKRLGEKLDPRQVFDRSGVISTMFPGLKPYSATSERTKASSAASAMPSLTIDTGELSSISEATKITAKNSIVLPSMARDIFLLKQNILKLVKSSGQTPQTKSGDWLSRQMAREASFEGRFKDVGKKGGVIGASNLASILGGKKRDGQTKESALYVESPGFQLEDLAKGAILPGVFKTMLGALGPLLLAGVGLGGLVALFAKLYSSKGAFLSDEESKAIDEIGKRGGLAGIKDEADKRAKLSEFERTKAEIADYEKMHNEGQKLNEKQLEGFAKRGGDSAKAVEEYKKANKIGQMGISPSQADSSFILSTPQGTLRFPDEDTYKAWQKDSQSVTFSTGPGNVKYVNKVAPEPVPAGAVTSGSGAPIRTGSGGYLTSGTTSTSPTQDLSIGDAINSAASATGVSAQTLAIFGQLESGLGKFVENKLSSARGPFQFIESTWLSMLQKHGKKYGYDTSSMTREEQLNLRFNNRASALMAAEYTKENAATLGINPGDPGSVDELYLAHFLGPGGAKRILSGEGLTEQQKAAVMKYNPNIKTGSIEEFKQFASGKTAQAAKVSAVQQIASAPSSGAVVASASTAVADGRRAPSSGGNVVVDASQKTTVASTSSAGKPASAYDKDIVDAIVSSSYA